MATEAQQRATQAWKRRNPENIAIMLQSVILGKHTE